MAWHYFLFLLGVPVLLLILLTDAQIAEYGEVSLNCPPVGPMGLINITYMYENPSSGKLEPAFVCYNTSLGFNRGAAAAVCRQLGYVDAVQIDHGSHYGTPHTLNCRGFTGNDSEEFIGWFIKQIHCPNVRDYVRDGELHIMRCSVSGAEYTKCAPVAVQCSSQRLIDSQYIYDGVVFTDTKSTGRVTIYLNGVQRPICWNGNTMNDGVATSICRQLGFTSGTGSSLENKEKQLAYDFGPLACTSESYPCFSHCISSVSVHKCQDLLSVVCKFKENEVKINSAGSRPLCMLSSGSETSPTVFISATIGLGTVSGLLTVAIGIIFTGICIKIRRKRHPAEQPLLNNNHERPFGEEQVMFQQHNDQRED